LKARAGVVDGHFQYMLFGVRKEERNLKGNGGWKPGGVFQWTTLADLGCFKQEPEKTDVGLGAATGGRLVRGFPKDQ